MGQSKEKQTNRARQITQIVDDLFRCDAVQLEIVEHLVVNARAQHPRRRERRWAIGAWSKWPIIIGIELVVIGQSDAERPPGYTPAEPMWPNRRVAVVPAPRIIEPAGPWWGWALLRALWHDTGLAAGLLCLLTALVMWVVLAGGEERAVIRMGGLAAIGAVWAPVVLCLVALWGFAKSAGMEIELMAMDWQAGSLGQ